MANAKKRTVHFYEPVRVTPDETEIGLNKGFWKEFYTKISQFDADEQFTTIRTVQYRGAARHCPLTSADYLYLGKTRDTIDYPESSIGDDDEQPLILEDGGRLVEPCYLYCVREPSNVVATLRASGGASISAVEAWITKVLKDGLGNDTIKLKPIVRRDQLERLEQAQSVTKFSIKLDKDQHPEESDGSISQAMKSAYESLGSGATMTFEWSYGNATPTPDSRQNLKGQIKEMLRWGAAKSAEATVVRQNDRGEIIRDQVDFLKDKVSFRVPVGDSPSIVQTADVVTAALKQASIMYAELDLPFD